MIDKMTKDIEENNTGKMLVGAGAIVGLFYGIKTGKSNIGILFTTLIGAFVGISVDFFINKK